MRACWGEGAWTERQYAVSGIAEANGLSRPVSRVACVPLGWLHGFCCASDWQQAVEGGGGSRPECLDVGPGLSTSAPGSLACALPNAC